MITDKHSGIFSIINGQRSECWVWIAGLYPDGYGQFRQQRAHRVSWGLHKGKIPKGKFICHHCDNPSCVRPSHLFVGTHQDNMEDRNRKGRQSKGSRHSEVMYRVAAKGTRHGSHVKPASRAIGDRNGSRTCPEKVVRGNRHWTNLYPEKVARGDRNGSRTHPENRCRGESHGRAKLTLQQVREIQRLYRPGITTQKSLAQKFNVSSTQIGRIVRKVTWNVVE